MMKLKLLSTLCAAMFSMTVVGCEQANTLTNTFESELSATYGVGWKDVLAENFGENWESVFIAEYGSHVESFIDDTLERLMFTDENAQLQQLQATVTTLAPALTNLFGADWESLLIAKYGVNWELVLQETYGEISQSILETVLKDMTSLEETQKPTTNPVPYIDYELSELFEHQLDMKYGDDWDDVLAATYGNNWESTFIKEHGDNVETVVTQTLEELKVTDVIPLLQRLEQEVNAMEYQLDMKYGDSWDDALEAEYGEEWELVLYEEQGDLTQAKLEQVIETVLNKLQTSTVIDHVDVVLDEGQYELSEALENELDRTYGDEWDDHFEYQYGDNWEHQMIEEKGTTIKSFLVKELDALKAAGQLYINRY